MSEEWVRPDSQSIGRFLNQVNLTEVEYTRSDYEAETDLPIDQDWEATLTALEDGVFQNAKVSHEVIEISEPYDESHDGEYKVTFDLRLAYLNDHGIAEEVNGVDYDPVIETFYFSGLHDLGLLPHSFE